MKPDIVAVTLCLVLLAVADSRGEGRVLRVSDKSAIPLEAMINDLSSVDLVFVGEHHTNRRHHEVQLEIIRALKRSGAKVAVGIEMFKADYQSALDGWVKGAVGIEEFEKVFVKNWGYSWSFYSDIFLYARNERIPMIGLNVPDEITRKVSSGGFASLKDEDRRGLPPGVKCDIDESYMDYIRTAHRLHGRDEKSFTYFCEAQILWDKAMAYYLVDFLKKNPGHIVVVLAGSSHSWKKGIPEQIKRESGYSCRVVFPSARDAFPETVNSDYVDYVALD